MIRGINKRIIEITDIESDMFEKALFFINSEYKYDDRSLEKEARRIVDTYICSDGAQYKPGYLRYSENRSKKKRIILPIFAVFTVMSILTFVMLKVF